MSLIFLLLTYSTLFVFSDTLITEPVQTPNGVTIHKRTGNFFDIEAPADQVWLVCSPDDPKEKDSFFFVLLLDGDTVHNFFYRRIYTRKMCLDEKKAYQQLMWNAKTIRLVGMEPGKEKGPLKTSDPKVPKKFLSTQNLMSHFFVRLQAGKKCKAFFSTDCDLPENYWAGTTPNTPFRSSTIEN